MASDCQDCTNCNADEECLCPEHIGEVTHDILWDNMPDDDTNGEDCPCYWSVEDALNNRGCDDYHARVDKGD